MSRSDWRSGRNYPVFAANAFKKDWVRHAEGVNAHASHFVRSGLSEHPKYEAAKYGGDVRAAAEVVHSAMDRLYIAKMKVQLNTLRSMDIKDPILVAPFKPTSQNMLARAAAVHLGKELGLEVDDSIIETDEISRKKLTKLGRIFNPAKFQGESKEGRWYIAVDDNMVSGSTFADLRSHLVQHGSRFAFACALSTPGGESPFVNVEKGQLESLSNDLSKSVRGWLKNVAGVGIQGLTRMEAAVLLTPAGQKELHNYM